MQRINKLVLSKRVNRLPVNLVAQPGIVAQARDRVGDVGVARDADALARVPRLELGEDLRVALHEVGKLVED